MALDPIALFETALKLNRRTASFIFFGFLLFALSIYLASYVQDSGISFWSILVYLVIFCVVIGSLSQMNGLLKTLISWALVLIFLAWLTALIVQILTQSYFTPPIATAPCLIKPLDAQCTAILASADLPPGAPLPTIVPPQPSNSAEMPSQITPGDNLVYVQFAVLPRSVVIDLSTQLVALGWDVAGADQGGQRLSAADRLMEVRYFNAEDKPRAELLANAVTDLRKATPPVTLRDLSGTPMAKSVKPGQFEIWMSR